MDKPSSSTALPIPVSRALRKLGHDIRDARLRRRIPVAVLAGRASISRTTLNKVEGRARRGDGHLDPTVRVRRTIESLADLADLRNDAIGLELEEENLPKRIRRSQTHKPAGAG